MALTRSSRKGFTLTEVVISLLILMIVWLSAVGSVIVSKYAASRAKHKVQAIYLAQSALEQMRRQSFQSPDFENYAATITGPVIIDTMGDFFNPPNIFMGNQAVKVTPVPDIIPGGPYRKRVQVTVSWTERSLGGSIPMTEYCTTDIANEPQLN